MRTRPKNEYKERIQAIKPQLKQIKGYRKLLFGRYPEYNNLEGTYLLDNAVRLKTTDVQLTERLEEIVKEWEAENAKEKEGEAV